MRIVEPSFEVLGEVDGLEMLKRIEAAGRTCYKSEHLITKDSAEAFVRRILGSGHESVIEHESIGVRIVCDRGVTHEIVRHRIASYSQESTRYCNYGKAKFGKEIAVIEPPTLSDHNRAIWHATMMRIERAYLDMLENGATPQIARSVLPNGLKTEIVMTANLREWRHFFRLRTASAAHPQMRELARPMLEAFRALVPVIFDSVGAVNDFEDMRNKAFHRLAEKLTMRGRALDVEVFTAVWETFEKAVDGISLPGAG